MLETTQPVPTSRPRPRTQNSRPNSKKSRKTASKEKNPQEKKRKARERENDKARSRPTMRTHERARITSKLKAPLTTNAASPAPLPPLLFPRASHSCCLSPCPAPLTSFFSRRRQHIDTSSVNIPLDSCMLCVASALPRRPGVMRVMMEKKKFHHDRGACGGRKEGIGAWLGGTKAEDEGENKRVGRGGRKRKTGESPPTKEKIKVTNEKRREQVSRENTHKCTCRSTSPVSVEPARLRRSCREKKK